MKYRPLHADELKELEGDFVRFLAANSIPAEDWEKMKAVQKDKAEEMIDIFSDFVFEQTLQKVEYLEFKSPSDIKTFHCLKDKMILNGLRVEGSSAVDFTKDLSPETLIQLIRVSGAKVKMYTAEKSYNGDRQMELFHLLESGARISPDGLIFRLLEDLKKK